MTAINLAQAKARLSELVARAEAGEDIQISRRGRPAIRLVPIAEVKRSFDWESLEAFTATLPPSTLTVEEMRRRDLL